jgi:hypothetical protein
LTRTARTNSSQLSKEGIIKEGSYKLFQCSPPAVCGL